jgi:transcriptional accessory protein Tex/SPT6
LKTGEKKMTEVTFIARYKRECTVKKQGIITETFIKSFEIEESTIEELTDRKNEIIKNYPSAVFY